MASCVPVRGKVTTKRRTDSRPFRFCRRIPETVYVPNYNPEWVWGPPPYGDYYPPLLYPPLDVGFSFFPGIDLGFYFGGGWGLWGGFGWGWGPNWFGGGIFLNTGFFHRFGFRDFHPGVRRVECLGARSRRTGWVFLMPIEQWRIVLAALAGCRGNAGFVVMPANAERKASAAGAKPLALNRDNGSVHRVLNARTPAAIAAPSAAFAVAAKPRCGVTTVSPAWDMRVLADSAVVEAADSTAAAVGMQEVDGDDTSSKPLTVFTVAMLAACGSGAPLAQERTERTLSSPEAAAQALIDATSKNDSAELAAVLGSKGAGHPHLGR